jgi:enamine deaminase RidA (YjgF/YER057c/UK114 family)
MKRTQINPWSWSTKLGYNQAEIIEGAGRQLFCAGQTAVDAEGIPQHQGDMRQQLSLALDNLQMVLDAANMTLNNIVRLVIYTTDIDNAMQHFDLLGVRFGSVGAAPPQTLVGVARLALPELLIEIEATAQD